jgi:hypothetical protein
MTKAISMIEERAKSIDTVKGWVNYFALSEPDLIKLVENRANNIAANIVNHINTSNRLPAGINTAIVDTAIVAVMSIITHVNELSLLDMGIDGAMSLGASDADRRYRIWLSGIDDDKYYDEEFMGITTGSEDWLTAVAAHGDYKKKQSNVVSKKSILSLLPPMDDVSEEVNKKELVQENVPVYA